MNENNGQAKRGAVLVGFTREEKMQLIELAMANKRSISGQVRFMVGQQLNQMK